MKLVLSKVELLQQESDIQGVHKQIELAGRTCYKSEDKITETSAKAFVNRMIESGHCYTGDSEVLTEVGWVKWRDYKGQKIATINPDLSFKGYEVPQRVVHHNYTGKFYEYPVLGLKVTDGHKMFGVFRLGNNDFYNNNNYTLFSCNTDFVDNNHRHKTNGERMFKTPRHCLKPIHTNPYMELVGFWLGDGCYNHQTKNKLIFHLKKKRKIEYLKELARLLGWEFTIGKGNYYKITHTGIGDKFNTLYYNNNNKKIDVGNFYSAEDIHSIITGLINSDGSYDINTRTITYTSTSKNIIDWLCTYAPLAGYTVSYKGVCKQAESNQKEAYKILFLTTNYTICNDSRCEDTKVLITEETEEVFCVTVSTGLILVRGTNGITTICGNCAMLEHGTVYLYLEVNPKNCFSKFEYPLTGFTAFYNWSDVAGSIKARYDLNKYSKVNTVWLDENKTARGVFITTNYRVIVENGWQDDLQFICESTEFHERRITLKFTTDRGVSHELVRHRVFSFAQESTRYCNYSKDKFGNELAFIIPSWLNVDAGNAHLIQEMWHINNVLVEDKPGYIWFIESCFFAEKHYINMLKEGLQPQQARQVLSNAVKTEIVMTGFASDWKHFFDLRLFGTTGKPHPDMVDICEKARKILTENNLWQEIYESDNNN